MPEFIRIDDSGVSSGVSRVHFIETPNTSANSYYLTIQPPALNEVRQRLYGEHLSAELEDEEEQSVPAIAPVPAITHDTTFQWNPSRWQDHPSLDNGTFRVRWNYSGQTQEPYDYSLRTMQGGSLNGQRTLFYNETPFGTLNADGTRYLWRRFRDQIGEPWIRYGLWFLSGYFENSSNRVTPYFRHHYSVGGQNETGSGRVRRISVLCRRCNGEIAQVAGGPMAIDMVGAECDRCRNVQASAGERSNSERQAARRRLFSSNATARVAPTRPTIPPPLRSQINPENLL